MQGFMIVKKLSEKQGKLTEQEWQRIDQILCEECGFIAHQTIQYGDFGLKRVFRCNCGRIEKQYYFKVRENKDCEEKNDKGAEKKVQAVKVKRKGKHIKCGRCGRTNMPLQNKCRKI